MKNLEALVHVSTAYCNCEKRTPIEEIVYPPPARPDQILELTKWISDEVSVQITPHIIAPRPNTYTFSKAIAESLVIEECTRYGIPTAIVRPSVVGSTWRDPLPGWLDNFQGPTTVFVTIGTGFTRSINIKDDGFIADLIPVEFPVNMIIAAAWAAATQDSIGGKDVTAKGVSEEAKVVREIPVYNCTSGQINGVTWETIFKYCEQNFTRNPMWNIFLAPKVRFSKNRYIIYFVINPTCILNFKLL